MATDVGNGHSENVCISHSGLTRRKSINRDIPSLDMGN